LEFKYDVSKILEFTSGVSKISHTSL
jgi:hypothetical protein